MMTQLFTAWQAAISTHLTPPHLSTIDPRPPLRQVPRELLAIFEKRPPPFSHCVLIFLLYGGPTHDEITTGNPSPSTGSLLFVGLPRPAITHSLEEYRT
jgi:hypothetical protein